MLKSILPILAAAFLLAACSNPPPQAAAPPPTRMALTSAAPPTAVTFATDRATLSPQAMASIRQVAANYKASPGSTVTLTGHADTVGAPDYNMALAQRRTAAVRNALVSEGVPASAITTSAQGEASLPVQTADNVNEERNRSVDIAVVGTMVPVATRSNDAAYCAALSARYRDYRTSQADEEAAAAMAQCQAGNTAAGIPVLEAKLTTARIPLPPRT
jgi:hypothetical protein